MKRLVFMLMCLFLAVPLMANAQQPPQIITDQTQAFIKGSFVVKGEGVPKEGVTHHGQKELTAKRAAMVVAQRNMAELLNGVRISGQTTVKDAALESDLIRSSVEGIVRDIKPIYESYDPLREIAVVYISIGIDGPNGLTGQLLPQVMPTISQPQTPVQAYVPPPVTVAPPPEPPQPFDALILDIKEHQFKPALINRILAQNGEILYDPTKIAQNILVERGAGDYTNDVGKAKALLSERGSRNPMVVKVAGVVKFTDVQVTGEDAANIFTANQKSNFLEGAKVVFVLK